MSTVLKVTNLSKIFKTETVLDNISFEVKTGSIIGIVGRNGSGKSVLFKIICGLYLPTSGSVTVFDEEITKTKTFPENTRAVIETPNFLTFKSGYKNLEYLSILSGNTNKEDIEKSLELVGLEKTAWSKKVKKYSMGMKQKLALAQVIMDEPQLIILDEPFNGLDDVSVSNFRKIITNLKDRGVTIIMASHIQEDIDLLCDKVYKIEHGKLTIL